ncbi:MAG TPA: hypothetical protein PLU37_00385 [Chitinophagaceae bacterium]|nr:hypothetical protein [Chitinophagaceae bacterium]MCB9055088.1 hypothetical protein [Chitinophagales bacterium]HPG09955.1 hypothetical protein [Chitinophagaceae bacterium]HRX93114.1 hypothetical protein [Chitinophagaceae bacterium]
MKLNLSISAKIFLTIIFFAASVFGFMLKLPSAFRGHDKELHALFYFLAAAFLNILFSNNKLVWHILIFAGLYLFSVSIEHAQEYSNRFFHKRIHGRYDPEDVKYNLKGLITFSAIWFSYIVIRFMNKKLVLKEIKSQKE